jgi:hypothetical protein
MKRLFYISIFLILSNCTTNKTSYWCGDHPCINKSEKEAYFKETMIVEIRGTEKEILSDNTDIEEIIQRSRKEEKKRIKEEKTLAKQVKLDEKIKVKEEKALAKNMKRDKKKMVKINKENIIVKTNNFRVLADEITRKNSFRPYPNINDIPD